MRRFVEDGVQHIYQRSNDGGVIFYDTFDRLIFLSVINHFRAEYKVDILAVSIMFNHFHLLVKVKSEKILQMFMRDVQTQFSSMYNKQAGRTGALFERGFGSASKRGTKYIRNAIAYVYNNHTEKKLCDSVLQMRWNLLAYAFSPFPFSEKLYVKTARHRMRIARKEVLWEFKQGRILNYALLQRIYSGLTPAESEQLTDMIIDKMRLVNYEEVFAFYSSKQDMVRAMDSVSGAEHDIKEPMDRSDDRPYLKIMEEVKAMGYSTVRKDFMSCPLEEKLSILNALFSKGIFSTDHIRAFLHY